jgi:hypothetical protein
MKRSEMERLLEQQLKEEHALDFLGDSPRVVAKEILHFLESKGMMPPATEGVIKIQELENGELCIPIWGWESEE